MKKRILFFLSLSLVASLGIGWFWLTEKGSVEAQSNPPSTHPLEAINQKAKDARTGNQQAAKDLVDEVVRIAAVGPELDGFMTDTVRNRVAKGESRYRHEHTEGVAAEKVARTINGLAYRLNLPNYSRTNVNEVTRLRFMLLPNFPQIISQNTRRKQATPVGAKFDSQMSPTEAFFVLMMMFQQKLNNPEYQLTDTERLSQWNKMHDHRPGYDNSPNLPENRNDEMRAALRHAGDSMSSSEALNLSELTLNTLGIEKEGGAGQ